MLDTRDWSVVKVIDTPGPGFFMRSHENTPYAWTDGMLGKAKDTLVIIDKRSLEIVRTLTPAIRKIGATVALRYSWQEEGVSVNKSQSQLEDEIDKLRRERDEQAALVAQLREAGRGLRRLDRTIDRGLRKTEG